MNKKKILDASNTLDDLEENSVRLGAIVQDIRVFSDDLSGLKSEVKKAEKINNDSNAQISKLNEAVDEVQASMITELRIIMAEGTKEQNVRIKDANEKLGELEGKLKEIGSEQYQSVKKLDGLNSRLDVTEKNFESFKNLFFTLQVISLLAIAYLVAERLGYVV